MAISTYGSETPIFPPKYITIVKESRSYPDNGKHSAYFEASNGIKFSVSGREEYDGAVMEGEYRFVCRTNILML